MKISSLTDPGLVRQNNEDYHLCDNSLGLAIVADGVGGHDYGEVASRIAVESSFQYLTKEEYLEDTKDVPGTLLESIRFANQQVIEHKEDQPDYKNMGTTLNCVHLRGSELSFSWIGDTRIYVANALDSTIHMLTRDHTLYNEMISRGEVADKYKKNILTRMVGSNLYTQPEAGKYSLKQNDTILVCTDGLSDLVPEEIILKTIMKYPEDLDLALKTLVELAKGQGGRDNITIVFLQANTSSVASPPVEA